MASDMVLKHLVVVEPSKGMAARGSDRSSQPEPKLGEMKSRHGWLGAVLQGLLLEAFMVSSQVGKSPRGPRLMPISR